MSRPAAPWFVVLPDTGDALPVVRALRAAHPRAEEIRHPSGRPWLLGDWRGRRPLVGRGADSAIALMGTFSMTAEALSAHAARLSTVHGLGEVQERLDGSAHVVATAGGKVRVQGTASGLRRVYRCAVNGVPVAGDRAAVLAALAGAAVDPARVAVRLLFPGPPWPLVWDSVWTGVQPVLPGHYLLLSGRDAPREARWWSPPVPDLPVTEAAGRLRTALGGAVAARVTPGRTVVADLSGFDSSAVCSLAARAGADVVALTAAQPVPVDDDVPWAEETIAGLRRAGHRIGHEIVPAGDSPLVYDGILSARGGFDEPFAFVHHQRRFAYLLGRGAEHLPQAHLTGLGGDEMCVPAPPWQRTLLRRRPVEGFRHLRAAARDGWSPARVGLRLLGERSYSAWLRATAAGLDAAADPSAVTGWGSRAVLPAWVAPDAVAAVRDLLLAAAGEPRLLADDPGLHLLLAGACAGAQAKRGFEQLADRQGVRLGMPFFDDRVLAAALAVRPAVRNDPVRHKPVLVEAMRGVVPAAVLGRVTRSSGTAAAVLGGRRHRGQLAGLADGSRLAELGLVDRSALRAAVHGPVDVRTPRRRIEPTIGSEIWLREQSEEPRARTDP
ncbi:MULTISPECIES: asparagine synthase-related protein [Thermomonosporaceae]|uniref:asparagine synthase-related protein n=1 Tax=Thermomonosporaceae TaxID=2012 RepID=UPI00255B1131|nr:MULTISPECIES: asparagine synthase-related protein [Thermomonosporaceae]MDL4775417.1 asparagine synthase-related protein [Actinomadura xylanilytica]